MLSSLNESQRAAVECIDAPSLVIAGAGSGKTRVLTYKIAYLLAKGIAPWNILALTFTNKAAAEMKQRIAKLLETYAATTGRVEVSDLWMGTFHSIFARILRIESKHIGFSSDFTIYDAADQKSLVRSIIREMGLDDKVYKPGTVTGYISTAKNRLITPQQYANDPHARERDQAARMPLVWQIYQTYMQRCRLSNAMDFDDLLLYTYYLFLQHPEVAQKYEERFHFVLVDEYQDTNFAQHQIIWQLTQHRQRLCVVGDDAQSIYSFRGANIENILTFQQRYQGAKLFKLEQNYRSTQNIVAAANSLIHHNQGQIHKDVFSKKAEGQLINVFAAQSDYEESYMVSRKIQALHQRDHLEYSDMAILYRTNAQSRSLEEALRKDGLPYRIYGGLSFYQRKEIKDVIAYLRLAVNPLDEEAMKRVINYPARGIGETTIGKIMECAMQNGVSPWNVLCDPEAHHLNVNKPTAAKLVAFAQFIDGYAQRAATTDAYQLAFQMAGESGLTAEINRGREPDDVARQENLQELMDGINAFVEQKREEGMPCLLTDYLQEVSLLSDIDENKAGTEEEKITLMTIHSAKGLEFRVVFVVGLEEELFPNQMALQEGPKGIEEERRLMYVAMTRAEEQLYLTTARSRFRFGRTEMSSPSRFLKEIDAKFLKNNRDEETSGRLPFPKRARQEFADSAPWAQFPSSLWGKTLRRVEEPQPTVQRSSQVTVGDQTLSVGQKVDHARFGRGEIIELEGTGLDAKATVRFDNVGTKQLLLRFAKITVVG